MKYKKEENVLLDDGYIKVTTAAFTCGDRIYPLHGISSLKLHKDPDEFPVAPLTLAIGFTGIGVMYKSFAIFILFGLIFFAVTFLKATNRETSAWITIQTSSGEEDEIDDEDYDDIEELYDILTEALEQRTS